jgi:hypothetical protein
MGADFEHICSGYYGGFESFVGYQIKYIGSNVNWLSSQKTHAWLGRQPHLMSPSRV